MANFAGLAAARHAVLRARLGRRSARASSARRRSPSSSARRRTLHPQGAAPARPRPRARRARAGRRPGPHARGRAARIAGPTIVCIQAGNVNTGAFDPVAEIFARAHAPAAPGCTSMARSASGPPPRRRAPPRRRRRRRRFLGDRRAQVAQRPLRQRHRLRARRRSAARRHVAQRRLPAAGEQRDPIDYTPEVSRRARGVEVWAALRSLGRAGSPT